MEYVEWRRSDDPDFGTLAAVGFVIDENEAEIVLASTLNQLGQHIDRETIQKDKIVTRVRVDS
jgi:hypothetical protein